jgi:hypothetical protein
MQLVPVINRLLRGPSSAVVTAAVLLAASGGRQEGEKG